MYPKKIYFQNLDGLRFLCFLSVFLFHSFYTENIYLQNTTVYQLVKNRLFVNGNIGVNFFFVLSGFLITYLLIDEKLKNGKINIRKFWIRRILRIWPLFYFCVFFGFFVFPAIKLLFGQTPNETASIWYYINFLNNFDKIEKGIPDASILTILWSVAVEEQFYFIWPILLYIIPTKKYYWLFFFTLLASLFFRAFNNDNIVQENHSLSCMGDLAIGAMGAWFMQCNNKVKLFFVHLKRKYIYLLYLIFINIYLFRNEILCFNNTIKIFERTIIAIVALFIILEQTYCQHSIFKLSNYKKISKLGIITYGLYCLHFIGILIVTNCTKFLKLNTHLWQIFFLETLLALIISIAIAQLSYRYYEKPFLKLKEKFSDNTYV